MSYWVHLKDKEGLTLPAEQHFEGGTYAVEGMEEAELNVTYNYSKLFSVKEKLNGKTGAETLPILKEAVVRFGVERDPDYWNPTEGNVGYMCEILRRWAEKNPEGRWHVS